MWRKVLGAGLQNSRMPAWKCEGYQAGETSELHWVGGCWGEGCQNLFNLFTCLVPGCLVGVKRQNSRVKKRSDLGWECRWGQNSFWDRRIRFSMVDPTKRKEHFSHLFQHPGKTQKGVHSEKKIYTYTQNFSFYLQNSKPNPCVNIYTQYTITPCMPFPPRRTSSLATFSDLSQKLLSSIWTHDGSKPV